MTEEQQQDILDNMEVMANATAKESRNAALWEELNELLGVVACGGGTVETAESIRSIVSYFNHFNLLANRESSLQAWKAATLVEREACADVCDCIPVKDPDGPWFNDDMSQAAMICAETIRKRTKK